MGFMMNDGCCSFAATSETEQAWLNLSEKVYAQHRKRIEWLPEWGNLRLILLSNQIAGQKRKKWYTRKVNKLTF